MMYGLFPGLGSLLDFFLRVDRHTNTHCVDNILAFGENIAVT